MSPLPLSILKLIKTFLLILEISKKILITDNVAKIFKILLWESLDIKKCTFDLLISIIAFNLLLIFLIFIYFIFAFWLPTPNDKILSFLLLAIFLCKV